MLEEALSQELANLLEIVQRLCQPIDYDKYKIPGPTPDIQLFMPKILFYLLVPKNSAIKSSAAPQNYLNQSAAIISEDFLNLSYHFSLFIRDLQFILSETFYGDEWYGIVCPLRS